MIPTNLSTNGFTTVQTSKSSKTATSSNKNSKTSFDNLMNLNLNSKGKAVENNTDVTVKAKNVMKEESTISNSTTAFKEKTEGVSNEVKELAKSTLKTPDIKDTTETEIDVKPLMDEMATVISSLLVTVAQTLNITVEELSKEIEEMGLDAVDLLDTENLKQLVLNLNGSQDITALLTDEELGNSVQELLKSVEEFKVANGLTDEKIASFKELNNQDELFVNKKDDVKVDGVELDNEPEIIVVKEDVNSQKTDDTRKDSHHDKSGDKQQDMKLTASEMFVQNLVNASTQEIGFTEHIAHVRQMQDITNQIVEQIKITINPEQTSMELQLNPESLGKVNLSVVYKDGAMTAQFKVQNEAVKEALESQIQILKDNFNNQGLKVESVEVTVSNFGFEGQSSEQNNQESSQSNSKNRPFRVMDDFNDFNEFEEVTVDELDENSISVNYLA